MLPDVVRLDRAICPCIPECLKKSRIRPENSSRAETRSRRDAWWFSAAPRLCVRRRFTPSLELQRYAEPALEPAEPGGILRVEALPGPDVEEDLERLLTAEGNVDAARHSRTYVR